MKALRNMLLSVALIALFATVGYASTTTGSDNYRYGSSHSITQDSIQPVHWRGYRHSHHGYYRHYNRPYYGYRHYRYYDYPSYRYYSRPGVTVYAPPFAFGFGF